MTCIVSHRLCAADKLLDIAIDHTCGPSSQRRSTHRPWLAPPWWSTIAWSLDPSACLIPAESWPANALQTLQQSVQFKSTLRTRTCTSIASCLQGSSATRRKKISDTSACRNSKKRGRGLLAGCLFDPYASQEAERSQNINLIAVIMVDDLLQA